MKARFALFLLFAILSLKLSVVFAQENIFTVRQPDYQKSPYTGMTRQHWIQAGEYLLKGAFNYIHTLDDQMYFPKQLDKTYPRNTGEIPVAKLEGLARTLFVAAPLLKDNPELEMNGIKVADYYRYQLINISNPESKSYIPHRTLFFRLRERLSPSQCLCPRCWMAASAWPCLIRISCSCWEARKRPRCLALPPEKPAKHPGCI